MPCLAVAVLAAGADSRAAEVPAITLRGSQILGPAQQDMGEADWLARLNNWKRDTQGQTAPWLTAMQSWRSTELARIGYDDAQYRRAGATRRGPVDLLHDVRKSGVAIPHRRTFAERRFLVEVVVYGEHLGPWDALGE